MGEIWKPISGFEGLYEVSSLGRVKNVKRGKILSTRYNRDGYARVALSKEGSYYHRLVHRLVALAFIGPQPAGQALVLHGNGNPGDNQWTNLRWGNNSQNMLDRGSHGTDWHRAKTQCVNGHPFTSENTYLNKQGHRSCQICRRHYASVSNEKRKKL